MASKKIITVFGATGAQGGAVANMFLRDAKLKPQWAVRAVTRDTSKPAATKLRDEGAEVVAVRTGQNWFRNVVLTLSCRLT